MELEQGGGRVRSFVLGGLLGASAVLAAARRNRRRRDAPLGLAAFEQAPCYDESVERDRERERSAEVPARR
jgi:hypothetical protein